MDFILGRGSNYSTTFSPSDFGITFRCKCAQEIISLDALVEMDIFAKINFIK